NRLVEPGARRRRAALVRDRVSPALTALGWAPRPGEDELTRQLRGDLVRALGIVGNDPGVRARAAEVYRGARAEPGAVDPNLLAAVIAVLAHAGDAARYEEFLKRFRAAATPQEEQRYLYALAGFRDPALARQTLERAINGEIRTQDAPFVVRGMLMSVDIRELAWGFVKAHWDTMDRLYPKHGMRRLAEGVTGLATPALEEDVHRFFAEKKPQFGGKVLQQYLEQLHVAVVAREREKAALSAYLSKFARAGGARARAHARDVRRVAAEERAAAGRRGAAARAVRRRRRRRGSRARGHGRGRACTRRGAPRPPAGPPEDARGADGRPAPRLPRG